MLIIFWCILGLMAAGAMLLLYRALGSQTTQLTASDEQPNVKSSMPILGWISIIFLPVVAFTIYFYLGSSGQIKDWINLQNESSYFAELSDQLTNGELDGEGVIDSLQSYLDSHPQSGAGWALLGRIYLDAGQYRLAEQAYIKADAIFPEDVNIQSNLVYASYLAAGGMMPTQYESMVANILREDPLNLTIQNLLAGDAYRKGDYATALSHWQAILNRYPEDSPSYVTIVNAMQSAEEQLAQQDAAMDESN